MASIEGQWLPVNELRPLWMQISTKAFRQNPIDHTGFEWGELQTKRLLEQQHYI
jgi:hypothetical protein